MAGVGRGVVVTVELMRTRLVDLGIWCDGCALPSVVELENLVRVLPGGRPQYVRGWGCTECGEGDAGVLDLG